MKTSSSNQSSPDVVSDFRTAAATREAVGMLLRLEQPNELRAFGDRLAAQGFTPVRRFIDELRDCLREYMDDDAGEVETVLLRSQTALPAPGEISPSWQHIWREFAGIFQYKTEVLRRISPATREGEWQVLLDNPYSNQHIAVYPGLTFCEAAYMYAYFRTGLEPSEFIRLQKVETLIYHTGAEG